MNAYLRSNRDTREAAENYRGEVFRFGDWRVVVCRNEIQWIVQRRTRNGRPDTGRWEAVGFFLTRVALVRLWRAATGDSGEDLAQLLPEKFRKVGA